MNENNVIVPISFLPGADSCTQQDYFNGLFLNPFYHNLYTQYNLLESAKINNYSDIQCTKIFNDSYKNKNCSENIIEEYIRLSVTDILNNIIINTLNELGEKYVRQYFTYRDRNPLEFFTEYIFNNYLYLIRVNKNESNKIFILNNILNEKMTRLYSHSVNYISSLIDYIVANNIFDDELFKIIIDKYGSDIGNNNFKENSDLPTRNFWITIFMREMFENSLSIFRNDFLLRLKDSVGKMIIIDENILNMENLDDGMKTIYSVLSDDYKSIIDNE